MDGKPTLESDDRSPLERWLSRHLIAVMAGLLAVGIALATTETITYAFFFPGPIEPDHGKWGQFGDFFGGTLNPVFGFLSFLALLLALILQSRELSISSRELANSARALKEQSTSLALQNFERTFFELVRLYNDNVKAIDLRAKEGIVTAKGRDCFRIFCEKRLKQHYNNVLSEHQLTDSLAIIQLSYSRFFEDAQHEVGHCFRTLYRAFKFAHESIVLDDNGKRKYVAIMRAQLSSFELALLFYNSLHPIGTKFKPLIERHAILKNMRLADLYNPSDHVLLYERSAYGDQDLSQYLKKPFSS